MGYAQEIVSRARGTLRNTQKTHRGTPKNNNPGRDGYGAIPISGLLNTDGTHPDINVIPSQADGLYKLACFRSFALGVTPRRQHRGAGNEGGKGLANRNTFHRQIMGGTYRALPPWRICR